MAHRFSLVLLYAVVGPPLGGLVTAAGAIAAGHARTTPLPELLLIFMAFGYPFGGLAALGAGLAHAALEGRLGNAALLGAVVTAGMLAHLAMAALIGNLGRVLESGMSLVGFAAPVVISATALCGASLWWHQRRR